MCTCLSNLHLHVYFIAAVCLWYASTLTNNKAMAEPIICDCICVYSIHLAGRSDFGTLACAIRKKGVCVMIDNRKQFRDFDDIFVIREIPKLQASTHMCVIQTCRAGAARPRIGLQFSEMALFTNLYQSYTEREQNVSESSEEDREHRYTNRAKRTSQGRMVQGVAHRYMMSINRECWKSTYIYIYIHRAYNRREDKCTSTQYGIEYIYPYICMHVHTRIMRLQLCAGVHVSMQYISQYCMSDRSSEKSK